MGYFVHMLLSVVLPTFQQAHRLQHTISGIQALQRLLPYPLEVVAVDRGSTDGTPELCEEHGFRVIRLEPNTQHPNKTPDLNHSTPRSAGVRGRGAAIRAGMLSARGIYRALIEGDWSIPPEQMLMLLPPVQTGFDVTIASRHVPGAVRINQPLSAYAASRVFNRLVRSLVLPDHADTQLGFKCFRAEAARALFSRCREDNAVIHVEALALARVFGLKVVEVPVDWTFTPKLGQNPLLKAPWLIAALLRVRARLTTGRYEPLQVSHPADAHTPGWFL